MLGGIYSSEKCSICGSGMKDNGRNAVCCPSHKNQIARRLVVRFGRKIKKRFIEYDRARRFLTGLQYKTDEGTFDARDYKHDQPLGFSNLAEKYLISKEHQIKATSFAKVKADMRRMSDYWGNTNVKQIGYAQIEDFLLSLSVGGKTRQNIRTTLHTFFVWLVKRRELRTDQMPEFPSVSYELGWRKTITKEVQFEILNEIKRLTLCNPRIWLGIKWLATYVSLRPGDLRVIVEEDIDLEREVVVVKSHKTSKHIGPKIIPLIEEDVEIIKSLSRGFPKMLFFRRDSGGGGHRAGEPFGRHILYDYWKQACNNLSIHGVDLYGGTRHSSMQHMLHFYSPEGVKRLSLHTTNKALDRYLEIDPNELREGYTRGTRLATPGKVTNILKIKE